LDFHAFGRDAMKSFSLPVFAAGVSASFALGFAIAWNLPGPTYVPEKSLLGSAAPAPQNGGQSATMNSYADLWSSQASAQQASSASQVPAMNNADDKEEQLRTLAQSDPNALHDLIDRLGKERDQRTKEMLLSVIGSVHKPEVVALTTRLATSGDAAQRKEGMMLLRQMPENAPEVRNTVKQILATEQSPDVLVQALSALRPSVVDPSESDAIVAQLRTLAQNPDPTVRSQSLLQLVQWDKNGSANQQLSQALNDPQAEVRQAAIFAVAQSGNRSDSVKASLMSMINSQSESKEVKGSALQALERFSLNKEEYASYNQARAQVGL
jgi:hypothetical protein